MKFLFSLVFSLITAGFALAVPINKDAEAIGRAFPKSSLKGGNVGKASAQIKKVLRPMQATKRNSRSSMAAVISKALDFRKDIAPLQQMATSDAVLDIWELAFDAGAFDRKGNFTGKATRGPYQGETLVFENIIPAKMAPEFAGYPGNVRLVPKSKLQSEEQKAADLDIRELAFLKGLHRIRDEYLRHEEMLKNEKSQVTGLDHDKEQMEKRYREEVEKAGDRVNLKPRIRIVGQKVSSPKKSNGNRYMVRFEVINMSSHPTEVEANFRIVGYTDNDNKLYEMKSKKMTLKLRQNHVYEYDLWTDNIGRFRKPLEKYDPEKSTKVYYRGFTAIVKFKDEVIATQGSDGRMDRIASGESTDPVPKI